MCGFFCPAQGSFRIQQLPLKCFTLIELQGCSQSFGSDQELQQFPRHQGAQVFQQLSAQLKERQDSERKNSQRQPACRSGPQRFPLQCQPFKLQQVCCPHADSPHSDSPDANRQPPERKSSQCQPAQCQPAQCQQVKCQQAQHSHAEHLKPVELFALLPPAEHLVLLEIAKDLEGKVFDYQVPVCKVLQ